jgi:hypothetical protein
MSELDYDRSEPPASHRRAAGFINPLARLACVGGGEIFLSTRDIAPYDAAQEKAGTQEIFLTTKDIPEVRRG